MLLSEEDAKTKWCPYARLIFDGVGIGNRWPGHDDIILLINSMCLGSGCMSWRWERRLGSLGDGDTLDLSKPVGYAILTRVPSTEGWCGLAGKPE